jgi:hypothetical protein
METEIGVPIEYDADKDFNNKVLSRGDKQEQFTTSISQLIDNERDYVPPNPLPERLHDERGPIPQNPRDYNGPPPQQYYEEPMYYQQPPPQQQPIIYQNNDMFSSFDKTVYIGLFIAVVLGFFIGRNSSQPLIIRPG